MKNIFILFIPPNNHEAVVHYEDTVKIKVTPDRIFPFVDSSLRRNLIAIFRNRPIAVWGSRDTPSNRSKFNKMMQGDDILIVEGGTIKLLGKIAQKTVNPDLSRELWKNLKAKTSEGWDLIYFIANPLAIDLPFSEFNKLFGYQPEYRPRGFTSVAEDRTRTFYRKYDELYSVLQKLKVGQYPELVVDMSTDMDEFRFADKCRADDNITDANDERDVSDHIVMQYKLAHLGIKAGSKVWVPKSDQQRIVQQYQFDQFESDFTAGVDLPVRYVENIDVIWKEEFRIDAAFEIENTTSIYSGLLRFSDLKIVAPNSSYPLFIVAPVSKRNRLIEQVHRPTFRKLDFKGKVRFLPYEAVHEIDKFFETTGSGLNVQLLIGRSEAVD